MNTENEKQEGVATVVIMLVRGTFAIDVDI